MGYIFHIFIKSPHNYPIQIITLNIFNLKLKSFLNV